MFFHKDGMCVIVEQGFRWANFTVQSDTRPLTDDELVNADGYELGCLDNDECWEMQDMTDGCWIEIEKGHTCTDEAYAEFELAWEGDSFCGVEDLGWSNDDTEYFYVGPLELTNEDTGEVFQGEPDNPIQQLEPEASTPCEEIEEMKLEEKLEVLQELEEEKKAVTDWFPITIDPVRIGTYQALNVDTEICWPFPSNVISATWDGKKWDKEIYQWRGLNEDPNKGQK